MPSPLDDPFADSSPRWMEGRVALVTGGGQRDAQPGVGYAICRVLAEHGASVAVLDRDLAAARRTVEDITARGGEAVGVPADVTDDEDCRRAAAKAAADFGRLDTLVNNVAVGDRAGLFDVTPERWDELVEINLKSAWLMTRNAVPLLPAGGAIVNISSAGVRARGPGMVYCVAKAGVENLTEGAAHSLGPQGIRVNCVQVGAIWSAFAAREMPEEVREPRRLGTALKTEGTPWDIAYAALFLASDRARWVSGHILSVDGGPPHRSGAPSAGASK
ncbi:MAG: SDR family oxidoreductase [Pseudonocardiaceae bacterium]|nr:SDR family oxidoreductase [Pseudonocardiaceae bacterium]